MRALELEHQRYLRVWLTEKALGLPRSGTRKAPIPLDREDTSLVCISTLGGNELVSPGIAIWQSAYPWTSTTTKGGGARAPAGRPLGGRSR